MGYFFTYNTYFNLSMHVIKNCNSYYKLCFIGIKDKLLLQGTILTYKIIKV